VHGPRFGLSLGDGLRLARVLLTPEAMLDGRRIVEFFSQRFFSTEFWLLWSTVMGSLPEHSAIEFRRYMNRFLYLFGHLSDMTGVMRGTVLPGSPADFGKLIAQETEKWGKVIKLAGIKPD
jgi:oleate hydratase